MRNSVLRLLVSLNGLVLVAPTISQASAQSGLYQIASGLYSECCGFAGIPFVYELPIESHAFVQLTVQDDTASMKFMVDPQTTFTTQPCPATSPIVFSFDQGLVSSNRIEFSNIGPNFTRSRYVVTFSGANLEIHGELSMSFLGCADSPTRFSHTNVIADLIVTAPTIESASRTNGLLQFTFTGEPSYDYFVEYTHALRPANWLALTNYRAKLETIQPVVTDAVTNAPARFYRLRKEPCFCD